MVSAESAPHRISFIVTILLAALASTALTLDQGWFESIAGQSCVDACTGKEPCHLETLTSINTKLEFADISLAGFNTNGVIEKEEYCAYPQPYSPAMDSEACTKFVSSLQWRIKYL